MMLLEWEDRPQDVANLLNPAFCGLLLHRAVECYWQEAERGMPFAKAFLLFSLVLHETTRRRLPPSVVTRLATWIQNERDVVLGFAERTEGMVPYTQEALVFLATRDLIRLTDDGRLEPGDGTFRKGIGPLTKSSDDFADCYKAALKVGRLLALSGDAATLYALLGIAP